MSLLFKFLCTMISQLLDLRIFFSVSDETKDKTDEILKLVPCYIA